MIVSKNELYAILKNSFQSSNFCYGNFDDPIKAIIWLENNGFSGIEELEKLLPYTKKEKLRTSIQFTDKKYKRTNFDCKYHSLLAIESYITDNLQLKMRTSDSVICTITHCHNRKFILHTQEKLAQHNISTIALWSQGSKTPCTTAALKSHRSEHLHFFDALKSNLPLSHAEKDQSITLICDKEPDMETLIARHQKNQPLLFDEIKKQTKKIQPKTTTNQYKPITLSEELWQSLYRLAEDGFVTHSDASLHQAGA